ncbi:hypothetical protein J6590_033752 [Homalodisca vitripennis]|nr:hypothetical protein J6590_033752 [Homalodisca vitripennis]
MGKKSEFPRAQGSWQAGGRYFNAFGMVSPLPSFWLGSVSESTRLVAGWRPLFQRVWLCESIAIVLTQFSFREHKASGRLESTISTRLALWVHCHSFDSVQCPRSQGKWQAGGRYFNAFSMTMLPIRFSSLR